METETLEERQAKITQEPVVGAPMTYGIGGDLYPYVIISHNSPARAEATYAVKNEDGKWTADPERTPELLTRRKDGTWSFKGDKYGYVYFGIGDRRTDWTR